MPITKKETPEETPKEETAPAAKVPEKERYSCAFCGKTFDTRSGIWKHMQKCAAKPDEDEEEEETEETGIKLFEEDEDEEEDTGYQCPQCGLVKRKPFAECPECGAELEWD